MVFRINPSGGAAEPSDKQRGAGGRDAGEGAALAQDQPTRGDRVIRLVLSASLHFGEENGH
jgi:hypothetical protein